MSDEPESGTRKYLLKYQHITCIVESGYADDIVAAAIQAGAPAATVSAGHGTGIRQRLGLIGINPKKEVIDVVLPKDVADAVFEAMIEGGQLEIPGKGFIYITDVLRGFPDTPLKKTD